MVIPTSSLATTSLSKRPQLVRTNAKVALNNSLEALLPLLEQGPGQLTAPFHDFKLGSAYQAIVSVSHGRVVGYEALLRSTTNGGNPATPQEVLNYAYRIDEMMHADRLSRLVHFSNFKPSDPGDCWLYINMHPHVFGMDWEHDQFITQLPAHYGIPPGRIVLELLEQFILDEKRIVETVAYYRSHGFMIAIDDFGSGHSNFNRVWDLRPDIVKLDRSLVHRSADNSRVQRALRHMVRMLHEAGTIVLAEGVETQQQALILLEADVDLLQGYWLGRPEAQLPLSTLPIKEKISKLWEDFAGRPQHKEASLSFATQPYQAAMQQAARHMSAGSEIALVAGSFLRVVGAHRFFILDEQGFQREASIMAHHGFQHGRAELRQNAADAPGAAEKFNPMQQDQEASWSRRAYFWRAIAQPGNFKLTGPYFSPADGKDCYTISVAVQREGETFVLCGDFFLPT